MKLPRSAAGWTIAVFGVLALVLGLVGLIRPEALLRLLGFEVIDAADRASGDYTRTYIAASSMAAVNMGVYYLVAVHTEWRAFFRFTVFFRLVTFSVFTTLVLTDSAPGKFFGVAAWEGLGAVATGVGLWLDSRRSDVPLTSPATGVVRSPTDAGR
ncbi:hypothetical protein [Micromonospora sp. NPDC004704]